METTLIRPTGIPATDTALMQALDRLHVPSDSEQAVDIGVEDETGEIYRVLHATGLCETVKIFESARRLGFAIGKAPNAADRAMHRVLRRPARH